MTVGGVHIINATNFLVRYLLQCSISLYSYSLPEGPRIYNIHQKLN